MGCSSSSEMKRPNNPLDEMLFREMQQAQRQRMLEKEQKQIKKLQKKLAKKLKKKRQNIYPNDVQIRTSQSSKPRSSNATIASRTLEIKNREKLSQQIENNIEQKLNKDLCGFLFDQITYSIEFFGNYESELTSILAEFLDKENAYNKNLEEHSILLANPLDAAVAKWIKYKPIHGPDKTKPQPLQATTFYVVFESIDISRPNDANYDSISPLCKVNLETDSYRTTPCKEDHIDILREIKWKGFVRLKLRDDPKTEIATTTKDRTNISEGKNIYGPKAISMTSSGYGTEGDYDYIYITQLNTHHPLTELKMSNKRERKQLNTKILPESCVSYLGSYVDTRALDGSDNDDFETAEESSDNEINRGRRKSKAYRDLETTQAIKRYKQEQEKRRQLLQQRYLNSKEFMRYFGDLMRQKLAKQLSLPLSDLKQATYRGTSIFIKDYEIIPAIHVAQNAQSWPECAFQFRIRERPIKKHPLTGQKVQWPTRAMLKQIETFGYHVIPLGYAPKQYRNPFRELEWRIIFPKAERYLERHLSHTQVKIFMMMKALVKTFIEPVETDKALMFAMDHLRTHLFWECERDFTAWPEEFIGDVLLRFIETFISRLRQKRLKDYFIEERNLFGSVPEDSLMALYLILSDIRSNPLMHLMVAFRNLDFCEKFFPKLNFKKIFQNLSGEGMVDLKKLSKNSRILIESDDDDNDDDFIEGQTGLLGMGMLKEKTTGKLRRRTIQLKCEIEAQQEEEKKLRGSIESIDVEFFFNNELRSKSNEHINQGVENLRRTNLLEIFLDHYLGMMKRAIKFRNIPLIQGWKAQAERLTTFYNDYGCDIGAKDYEDSIAMIADIVDEIKTNVEFRDDLTIPALPPIRMSPNEQKTKKLKSAEINPYEEVLPADENLPSLQNAMKAWENRLYVRHEEIMQSGESTPESLTLTRSKAITVEVYESAGNMEREEKNGEIQSNDEEEIYTLKEESKQQYYQQKINLRKKNNTDNQNLVTQIKDKKNIQKFPTKPKNKENNLIIRMESSSEAEDFDKNSKNMTMKKVSKGKNNYELTDNESVDSVYQTKKVGKKSRKADEVDYRETSFIEHKNKRKETPKLKEIKKLKRGENNEGGLDSDYDSCKEVVESSDDESNATNTSSERSHKDENKKPEPRRSVTFKQTPLKDNKREKDINEKNIDINEIVEEDTDASENSECENEKRSSSITFKCLEDISFKALEAQIALSDRKDSESELKSVVVENGIRISKENKKRRSGLSRKSSKCKKLNKNQKQEQKQKYRSEELQKSDWESDYSVDTTDENESQTNDVVDDENEENKQQQESSSEGKNENKASAEPEFAGKSFLGRIINTEELLKNLSVLSPSTVETVTESTQKIMKTLRSQEKRTQLRDAVKKKTIQLKGALFQSSET